MKFKVGLHDNSDWLYILFQYRLKKTTDFQKITKINKIIDKNWKNLILIKAKPINNLI